jgi:hypothetical protein
LKAVEELPAASLANLEELEARDVRGKCVVEMIQKKIAMASSAPKEYVTGLVDVIDEMEELCYIDDDAPAETMEKESSALKILEDQNESTMGLGENSDLKPHDPINLDSSEAEEPAAGQSRSPPAVVGDVDESTAEATGEDTTPLMKETNVLQLEKASVFS